MISIIIPVYNVEKYLRRCLDSCLSQTFTNIEIIAVDDGSKDRSGLILDEYAQKKYPIKVIHKKNEGVYKARMIGLDNITGDYFCFLDADDFLPNDCLQLLYEELVNTDADMVFGNYVEFSDNCKTKEIKFVDKSTFSSDEYLNNILLDKIPSNLWGKLYRKKILSNKIEETAFKLGEDTALLIQLIISCNKIATIEKSIYNYYQREDSAVHAKRPAYISDMYFYRTWVCDFLQKNSVNKYTQKNLDLYLIRGFIRCIFCGGLCHLPLDEYKKHLKVYSTIKSSLSLWERLDFKTCHQKKLNQFIVYSLQLIRNITNACK